MEASKQKYLTYLYTGDGKGKTSSAFGVALRAAGKGHRVNIIQFMKGPMFESGEFLAVQKYLSELVKITKVSSDHWINLKNPLPVDIEISKKTMDLAFEQIVEKPFLFVLDEVNTAVGFNLLSAQTLIDFCDEANKNSHVIITGRNATQELIDRADLVTEMKNIKHPYEKGILAVEGLEW